MIVMFAIAIEPCNTTGDVDMCLISLMAYAIYTFIYILHRSANMFESKQTSKQVVSLQGLEIMIKKLCILFDDKERHPSSVYSLTIRVSF